MDLIYEPNGRAREYSPLALNIYRNCDHNCIYCYNRNRELSPLFPGDVQVKERFRERLVADLGTSAVTRQVLLSFVGDPYCHAELTHGHTRFAFERLSEHQVPVAILTKGGRRALRDLDLFASMHCKVGTTLTFEDEVDSLTWEPSAAFPLERIDMLKRLKEAGVRTWVSLEPVIDPVQTLALIDRTHGFVDEYRVGKLNHLQTHESVDWRRFVREAVAKLRGYGTAFYVKKDLQCFARGLTDAETDPDNLVLSMEAAVCA